MIKTVVEIQGENGVALTGKQFTDADSAASLEKVGVINNFGTQSLGTDCINH